MGVRELVVGRSSGKSAWQHLKDKWASSRAEDRWQEAFKRAYNPLGLRPGDLVDMGLTGDESYEVDSVIWYATPAGSPDFTRYGLRPLIGDGYPKLLEAMEGDGPGEVIHAIFEPIEDLPLDDELIELLEGAEIPHENEHGQQLVYVKDFQTEADVHAFGKDWALTRLATFTFNFYDPDDEQAYVSVDALDEPHNTASAYEGRAIDAAEINAIGTVSG